MSTMLNNLWRSPAVRLFLVAFVVFNVNLRSISSLDTYATRILPISIVGEFNLDLDEFPFMHERPSWAGGADQPVNYLDERRGHFVSTYPVMPAILAAPVYAIPVWLGLTEGNVTGAGYNQTEIVATVLSKIAASLAVALSVVVVYLALQRITTLRGAFWIALIYAFATSSWSVSSQGLWQTSMSQPLLALSLYWLMKGEDEERYIVYSSLPLALAVASRQPAIVFALVYAAYVLFNHRKLTLRFAIAPCIIAALLVAYNLYYFESLWGGYSYVGGGDSGEALFSMPSPAIVAALLFSPSRGILTLSPVLLFAVVGMVMAVTKRGAVLHAFSAAAIVLTVIFYSTWQVWDGAFSYSYRFLVDMLPAMCICMGLVWESIIRNRAVVAFACATVAFSVLIQVTGAFFYPCGWLDTPLPAGENRERFWDWSDPEFVRCLSNGPVVPDGIRFFRDWLS